MTENAERDGLEAELRYERARLFLYDAAVRVLEPYMEDDDRTVEEVLPLLTPRERKIVEAGLGQFVKVPRRS